MWTIRDLLSRVTFGAISSPHYCPIDRKIQQMIANAMTEDNFFQENWKRFYDGLDLKQDDKLRLDKIQVPYDRYVAIMEQWISFKPSSTISDLVQILRSMHFNNVADLIMRTGIPEEESKSIRHGLKNVSSTFIGRDDQIQKLQEFYESNKGSSVVLVHGLGGMGKTELVTAFACNKVKKNNVVWLNGDSKDKLKGSIIKFIKMGTSRKQAVSDKNLISSFNVRLSEHCSQWILVFDNVDEVNPLVDHIIENLRSLGREGVFMIVTSRNAKCINSPSYRIALDKFCRKDSKELVSAGLKHCVPAVQEEDVDALCDALQDFPLALQQAVSFIGLEKEDSIQGKKYSIDMYLEAFRNRPVTMLGLGSESSTYGNTIVSTVMMTIDKLSNEDATGALGVNIFKLLALTNPDDLRFPFLQAIYKLYADSEVEIENAVRRIKTYSLIKAEGNKISIHRLVQTVTRQMDHDIEKSYYSLIKVLTNVSCGEVEKGDIEHIKTMWGHLIDSKLDSKDLCLVPQNVSEILLHHSCYGAALTVCEDSLEKFKGEFEENIAHKLKVRFNCARCYNYREEFNKSLEIIENISAVVKEKCENDYDFLVAIELETASVHGGKKELEKSGELYAKAHSLARDKLGEAHRRTMTAKHGLGIVLLDQNKQMESYAYLNEVYEWRIKNLGSMHPSTYRTQYYLGRCLYERGQHVKSKEILETALENEKSHLDGHKHTMLIWGIIVKVYVALKENSKAVEIQTKVCEVYEKTLGKDHATTKAAKVKLARLKNTR